MTTVDNAMTTVDPCYTWEFQCNNGMCIARDKRCDGLYDCGDFSDEHNCCKLKHFVIESIFPSCKPRIHRIDICIKEKQQALSFTAG